MEGKRGISSPAPAYSPPLPPTLQASAALTFSSSLSVATTEPLPSCRVEQKCLPSPLVSFVRKEQQLSKEKAPSLPPFRPPHELLVSRPFKVEENEHLCGQFDYFRHFALEYYTSGTSSSVKKDFVVGWYALHRLHLRNKWSLRYAYRLRNNWLSVPHMLRRRINPHFHTAEIIMDVNRFPVHPNLKECVEYVYCPSQGPFANMLSRRPP